MQQLAKNSELELWFSKLTRPEAFVSPFINEEYVVLLVINRKDILYREQKELSEKLVNSGCRYAVCFGFECSSWDDSIDYAYIFSDPNLDPPKERFVMTTWHESEPIEEVVEYFRWNTVFEDFVPKRFLVLFVGENKELEEKTQKALESFFRDYSSSPTATNL
jgi:hypothetical protein